VVGVVVAEHHVRHVTGSRPRRGQRGEQRGAVGHHPGVDDDHALAVGDEHDGAGDPVALPDLPHVALVQDVDLGGAGLRKPWFTHNG
jgi:hypothetical protein